MISNAEVCYFQADADYRRQMGENQSSLKHILSSPAHYLAAKTRRFIPSPVMTIDRDSLQSSRRHKNI